MSVSVFASAIPMNSPARRSESVGLPTSTRPEFRLHAQARLTAAQCERLVEEVQQDIVDANIALQRLIGQMQDPNAPYPSTEQRMHAVSLARRVLGKIERLIQDCGDKVPKSTLDDLKEQGEQLEKDIASVVSLFGREGASVLTLIGGASALVEGLRKLYSTFEMLQFPSVPGL